MQRKYKVPHKRRKEKKTDYKSRLSLLRSGKNRIVIRKSNKHILGQLVKYEKDGDKIIASAHSSMLKNLGWKNGCGNVPAAYLTGFLLGKKAKEKKSEEGIVDMGLQISSKGNRIYAFIKGVSDAGINVRYSEDIVPEKNRIEGTHIDEKIKKQVEEVKNKIMK